MPRRSRNATTDFLPTPQNWKHPISCLSPFTLLSWVTYKNQTKQNPELLPSQRGDPRTPVLAFHLVCPGHPAASLPPPSGHLSQSKGWVGVTNRSHKHSRNRGSCDLCLQRKDTGVLLPPTTVPRQCWRLASPAPDTDTQGKERFQIHLHPCSLPPTRQIKRMSYWLSLPCCGSDLHRCSPLAVRAAFFPETHFAFSLVMDHAKGACAQPALCIDVIHTCQLANRA